MVRFFFGLIESWHIDMLARGASSRLFMMKRGYMMSGYRVKVRYSFGLQLNKRAEGQ